MSEIVEINKVLVGFRAMLVSALPDGIKVGEGKAPDKHGDGYVVVYASTTASRDEGSFSNPEGTVRARIQVTCVGKTDQQSNAILDRVNAAVFSTNDDGSFRTPIPVTDHVVWHRSKVADIGSANEGVPFQRTILLDLSVSNILN